MEIVEYGRSVAPAVAHGHGHGHSQAERDYMLRFGWWAYIASEVMLFSSLIGVFLLAKRLYPEQIEILEVPLVTFNTFLLLMSSWAVVRSLGFAQQNNTVATARWLFISGVMGTVFVGIQIYEYNHLSHLGLTLTSSMFGSAFYVLTGFHGVHVAVGVVWLFRNFIKALNGDFNNGNTIGLEVMGLYWHFVDVVWVFLFPLIYLIHFD